MNNKEQIMIDGVDVSGCRNFDKESYKLDVYDCDLNELHGYCSCNNDCYFKQLVRKTQECEQKDKQIKEWNEYTNLVRSWIIQAAKDLGLDTEHSFGVEHFTFAVRCLKEENKKLKQECEELKKEYEKQKNTWLKQSKVIFLKKKSIEALKKAVLLKENNRYIQSCLTQEKQLEYEKLLNKLTRGVVLPAIPEPEVINLTDRYRKALEEIEKELKEDVYCESQECGCDDFKECLNCVKTQILDIINKAKGGVKDSTINEVNNASK